MRVSTTRFGDIEAKASETFEFKEGLLGFGQLRRFIILDDPHDEIFAWLQSCENPDVAFPLLEPEIFTANFDFGISRGDVESLNLEKVEDGKVFCIITIPKDPTNMTANMKAPILLNLKELTGRQCVLQDNSLAIREPIFSKLQQRVMHNPQASFKPEPAAVKAVRVPRSQDAEL